MTLITSPTAFITADSEAVREEGKVPVFWSELRSTHHLCQGSKQDMIVPFGMPTTFYYMLTSKCTYGVCVGACVVYVHALYVDVLYA